MMHFGERPLPMQKLSYERICACYDSCYDSPPLMVCGALIKWAPTVFKQVKYAFWEQQVTWCNSGAPTFLQSITAADWSTWHATLDSLSWQSRIPVYCQKSDEMTANTCCWTFDIAAL